MLVPLFSLFRLLKLARHFSAGFVAQQPIEVPSGTKEMFCRPSTGLCRRRAAGPALKCWAIFRVHGLLGCCCFLCGSLSRRSSDRRRMAPIFALAELQCGGQLLGAGSIKFMSTIYGIISLGFIGFLGFCVGLFGYWQSVDARHAMERAGDTSRLAALHILTITSGIALWGGLAVMTLSALFYFLYRRWRKDDRAA